MSDERHVVARNLDDEYELNQLNPVYSKTKQGEASQKEAKALLDDIPEKASMEMRLAAMEAIVEDIVEDVAEEHRGDGTVDAEAHAAVDPMIDKAVTLHLIPEVFKKRVPYIIAKHLKIHDPMYALLSRTAHYITDAVVKMEDDKAVVDEVIGEKTADIGADITEETVVREGDNAQDEDGSTPTVVNHTCRYLARSAVNHRKSTALMCKRIAGPMLSRTLYELRNQLPQRFKDKYKLDF